jgi:hypothetical protein
MLVDVVEVDVRKAPRTCVDLDIGSLTNTVSLPEDATDAGHLPEWKDSHPCVVGFQNLQAP